MKWIFLFIMLLVAGWALGYLNIKPERSSTEMSDFEIKAPEKL